MPEDTPFDQPTRKLSPADTALLLDLIENPPPPTQALIDAAKHHRELFPSAEETHQAEIQKLKTQLEFVRNDAFSRIATVNAENEELRSDLEDTNAENEKLRAQLQAEGKTIMLSERDALQFMEALENPGQPNERVKQMLRRFK